LVNKTTCANQVTIGVFGWYSLRLDLITSIILIAGCTACILLRSTANPVFLSMMLQYLLTLQQYLKYSMSNFGEIERKMVSTQRLYDLELIP
jgi:ABC-type multidrug transport system fused ATPase/permease subunit